VAFVTDAGNLGPADGNGLSDVYVKDLTTGATILVSANAAGTSGGNGESRAPVFSPDGTKVAFTSDAGDLGPDDAGSQPDLYLRR
jgi:Tol biopolymer transport system component